MSPEKYHQYPHPELIGRAKELRRPMTPAEAKLWSRLKSKTALRAEIQATASHSSFHS